MRANLLHLCSTFCNPVDCSPPGSTVHGILRARILEWVAMPSSKGSSRPRDWTHIYLHWQTGSLSPAAPRKPLTSSVFINCFIKMTSTADPGRESAEPGSGVVGLGESGPQSQHGGQWGCWECSSRRQHTKRRAVMWEFSDGIGALLTDFRLTSQHSCFFL